MKRLFIAIDISDNLEVNNIIKGLKNKLNQDKIGWVKPENMHITVKFIGSTPSEKTKKIVEITKKTCEHIKPFELKFSKIGIFGSSYKPRVIWIGFEENIVLSNLAENIKKELDKIGYPYDRQNFVPHLTLGRISKIESKKYFQSVLDGYKDIELKPILINNIYLFESVLQKTGPEYRIIESINLQ